MKNSLLVNILLALGLLGCTVKSIDESDQDSVLHVPVGHDEISYQGRLSLEKVDSVNLYWSGTSIKLNFEGDSLFAILKDAKGDNYFNVILDSDSIRILRPDTIKTKYLLAAGLKGSHSVEIFKRTEAYNELTTFYGFEITGEAQVLKKDKPNTRSIAFYGDSITAGYAVDDTSGKDSPDSVYTNHYVSYAMLTAREFDADYQVICRSGIGIMVSWFPQIMPEMFDRLDPNDPNSKWDFGLFQPDVVVINLFQNDSWLVEKPEYPEFVARFGSQKPSEEEIIEAYQKFVLGIRSKHPEATIICALGNMDATKKGSPWPSYIERAVDQLDDQKVLTHFMPFKETPGHPNREEQKIMAASLTKFIQEEITW